MSPSLFQPLMPVDLVQYHDNRKDLHRFSEIKAGFMLQSIPLNPAKAAIAIFVAEYLSKVLREHLENRPFFEFCMSWISRLDELDSGFESAHLGLVWHSFSSLGIAPEDCLQVMETAPKIPEESLRLLQDFLESESPFAALRVSSPVRQVLLDALVRYASGQLEGMGEIKSLAVLRQVFS
jgi:DNA repair protein RecO (recombination protein O)